MSAMNAVQAKTEAAQRPITSREFRDVMGRFASGVVVISTSTPEDGHHAMTAIDQAHK